MPRRWAAGFPCADIPIAHVMTSASSAPQCKMPLLAEDTESEMEYAMQIHDKAPEFTLPDEEGRDVSLKQFRGKNVVLYFFPKADTPG